MSTSSKKSSKKELPIYDPEGADLENIPKYEEVKVPLQEHITNTRIAIKQTCNNVHESWLQVREDTRANLTGIVGKTRKHTNTTLSSLGFEDIGQLARGSAYVGAALTGLYLARRRSLFIKMMYPFLGVGLVGVALHRHTLSEEYRKITMGSGFQGNWSSWQPLKSEKGTGNNLEKIIKSSSHSNQQLLNDDKKE